MFSPGGHAGTCRRVAAAAKRSTPKIVQLHSVEAERLGNRGEGGRNVTATAGRHSRPVGQLLVDHLQVVLIEADRLGGAQVENRPAVGLPVVPVSYTHLRGTPVVPGLSRPLSESTMAQASTTPNPTIEANTTSLSYCTEKLTNKASSREGRAKRIRMPPLGANPLRMPPRLASPRARC